uniref:Ookinete surface protein P28 n=1 Tax=Plasmodium fieldi TaxID=77518 RepID=A0A1B0WVP3_9APIC|nr:ookinete surface protein P28 [Plasmodium fieldi]
MNTYHSLLFLLAIVLAVKHTFAAVTADTKCQNGYLIQMSDHFECKCNDQFVLKNENTCEEEHNCSDPKNVNKSCGEYAMCVNTIPNHVGRSILCICREGYALMNNVCVPNICDGVSCGQGKCIVSPTNENYTMCSCDIGTITDESRRCTEPGKTECAMKCKANEECKLTQNYYRCVAKEGSGEGSGGEGSGGEGSGGETGAAYSLMNGSAVISILVVFAFFMMSLV